MRQFKLLVGDTDAPFEIRVPAIGIETYLAPVKLTSIAGNDFAVDFEVEVAQSGTAGYNGLLVNVTETSTGSGTKLPFEVRVNGVSRLLVDSEGGVGIGTATPLDALHIVGKFRVQTKREPLLGGRSANVTMQHVGEGGTQTLTDDQLNICAASGTTDTDGGEAGETSAGSRSFAAEDFTETGRGADYRIGTVEAGTTTFVDRLIISDTGHVGIGNTPSGDFELEVTGAGSFSTDLFLPGLPTSDPTNAGQVWNDSGTLKISSG